MMKSFSLASSVLRNPTKKFNSLLSPNFISFLKKEHNFLHKFSFSTYSVPQSVQVIICGAGAVGNSVAYHMNQNGWKDIVVLEQSKIGSGDSWRSCGIVGHFHSTTEGRLTTYSSELYKQLQNEGHDIGYKTTGSVNIARSKERMIELRRLVAEARLQLQAIKKLCLCGLKSYSTVEKTFFNRYSNSRESELCPLA